jgi:3-oxoacyl-[acyl-carrier-protein] synthase-1
MPSGVTIQGMGLACAIGVGADPDLLLLRDAVAQPSQWTISELGEPFTVPIYRIPDPALLTDVSRVVALIEGAVTEATTAAGLTREECAALPIFIGSAAFSLDRDSRLGHTVDDPLLVGVPPVPAHEQIAFIVRRALGSVGKSFAYQTACTSSANAALSAARMVQLGWYRHALVIGVELANVASVAGFSSLQLTARAIMPFDRDREGIVLGEGIGVVVLSQSDVRAPGIHVKAGGANIDSFRVTTANPDGAMIAALQRRVLDRASVAPTQIRGIKAHGTGSPMNDAGESAAIQQVFASPPPVCALKPYVGHTLGACGVIELILMANTLSHGVFPATSGFVTPDPSLGIQPTAAASVAEDGHYLLNYFGFGGHNTVLLVEKRS